MAQWLIENFFPPITPFAEHLLSAWAPTATARAKEAAKNRRIDIPFPFETLSSYSVARVAAVHPGRGALFRQPEIEVGDPGIGRSPGRAVSRAPAGALAAGPETTLHLLSCRFHTRRRVHDPVRQELRVGGVDPNLDGLQVAG